MATHECSISEGLLEKLTKHAAVEQTGSQYYLAASFFFEQKNFKGIAKYLAKESESERAHALEFYSYIHRRGGRAMPGAIPAIDEGTLKKWDCKTFASAVFAGLLDLEYKVEESINNLMNIAQEQKDHATAVFLQKFVETQVTEIDEMRELVEKAQAYDALPGLLYHLDAELS